MTDSFHAGGPYAYAEALRERYESLLADLRERLDSAEELYRADLRSKISRIEFDYKSKLDGMKDSLF